MYQLKTDSTLPERIKSYIQKGWIISPGVFVTHNIYVEDNLNSRLIGTNLLRRSLHSKIRTFIDSENQTDVHDETYEADYKAYSDNGFLVIGGVENPLKTSYMAPTIVLNKVYDKEWVDNNDFFVDIVELMDSVCEDFIDIGVDELLPLIYGTYAHRPLHVRTSIPLKDSQHEYLTRRLYDASIELGGLLGTLDMSRARNTIILN